jgi:hypothetical protein
MSELWKVIGVVGIIVMLAQIHSALCNISAHLIEIVHELRQGKDGKPE